MLNPEPIVKKLHGAFCRGVTREELLTMAASQIRASGSPYTSVYMYMLDPSGRVLRLEAYDGRDTEHTMIPVGRGLCGKAVAESTDLNVADVAAAPDYLACSVETKSELIVLIRRHDQILGQIDIDSDAPNGFDEREHAAVTQVADALASLL